MNIKNISIVQLPIPFISINFSLISKSLTLFSLLMNSLFSKKKSAILFGPENSGLTNNELRLADYIFTIPTFGSNKSLNLSHAVSIITFKLNEKKLMIKNLKKSINKTSKELASKYEISEYMKFLIENLDKNNFFYPIEKRESMINNIFSIYSKADLSKKELNMLWGMLKKL